MSRDLMLTHLMPPAGVFQTKRGNLPRGEGFETFPAGKVWRSGGGICQ